jgi:hypothetical protein
MCIYSESPYEWDPKKALLNRRKHGVAFADAVTVFQDERAVTLEDSDPEETRFVTLGLDALGRVIVVAYTWRGDRVRLISARRATPAERRQYEADR